MSAITNDKFDLEPTLRTECEEAIREGSKSFLAASLLLPGQIRVAARALYAFCRAADDLVDDGDDCDAALVELTTRLDLIYKGGEVVHGCDQAFAAVAEHFDIPREVPDAMIEGFAWDAEGRTYETIDDLAAYCARVASTVGMMMTLIMGSTDRHVLARAADLGLAMQLTNIARDVGEDAHRGRIYLPINWMHEAGIDPDEFLKAPKASPELNTVVERLLDAANTFYSRAMTGIAGLPFACRVAIRSAALIYREIGREIERNGWDSVNRRACTSKLRKLELIAYAASTPNLFLPVSTHKPHLATQFLVEAAAQANPGPPKGLDAKAGRMIEIIAVSENRKRFAEVRP